jgi:hypothetical protein
MPGAEQELLKVWVEAHERVAATQPSGTETHPGMQEREKRGMPCSQVGNEDRSSNFKRETKLWCRNQAGASRHEKSVIAHATRNSAVERENGPRLLLHARD